MYTQAQRYESLMRKLNVPEQRQICSQSNLKWFLRSGATLHRHQRDCSDAIDLAKALLKSDRMPN